MFISTVWLGATVMFFLPRLAGGDPTRAVLGRLQDRVGFSGGSSELIQSYRDRFGLDEPLYQQYLSYLERLATFDFGYSLTAFPARVNDMIATALPWTIGLLMI